MLNIMIIAGKNTKPLTQSFKDRDGVNVLYSFNTIKESRVALRDKVVEVDKLVYVYQDPIDNIIEDMSELKNFLRKDFVTVNEVVLFIRMTEETKLCLDFFKKATENYDDIKTSIKKSKGNMTYARIYDELVGAADGRKIKTTYLNQYRFEAGNNAKSIYLPSNEYGVVEPFDLENLKTFKNTKDLAESAGITNKFDDDYSGSNINAISDNINIKPIIVDRLINRKNIFVISGARKSGLSVTLGGILNSIIQSNKSALLINLKSDYNKDAILDSLGVETEIIDTSKFLLERKLLVKDKKKVDCIDLTFEPKQTKLNLIHYMFKNSFAIQSDVILLYSDIEDVEEISRISGERLNRILLTSEINKSSLFDIIDYLKNKLENKKITLIFNNILEQSCRSYIEFLKDSLGDSLSDKELYMYEKFVDGVLNSPLLNIDNTDIPKLKQMFIDNIGLINTDLLSVFGNLHIEERNDLGLDYSELYDMLLGGI